MQTVVSHAKFPSEARKFAPNLNTTQRDGLVLYEERKCYPIRRPGRTKLETKATCPYQTMDVDKQGSLLPTPSLLTNIAKMATEVYKMDRKHQFLVTFVVLLPFGRPDSVAVAAISIGRLTELTVDGVNLL